MSEHLQLSPTGITEQAIEAAEAGAEIRHLHARDFRARCRPPPNVSPCGRCRVWWKRSG
ncbi:3-keto-5-aminohexanoate cleavage protein [Burkholderia paludis]|uniref:3-keto-5-aminohexanoate cleavage protein n=1 Tax=Burkholderia paludis TaxID=1506587 RepID=UPI0009DEAFE0